MPHCTVLNTELYFERAGQGPAVVLLHHATASSGNWRRQTPDLARRFQVYLYDRPGFGRSQWQGAWSPDYHFQDADQLIALLDHWGLDQAALVGHSDGATIALLAAARHPTRISCVVAEAPHVFVDRTTCPGSIREFLADLESSDRLKASLARDHGDRGADVVARWRDRWLDPAFWDWDVSHQLPAVRCPVLVIHGATDPFFPVSHSELIANQVADGRTWVLLGVGHTPHLRRVDSFNREVLRFLQKVRASCP